MKWNWRPEFNSLWPNPKVKSSQKILRQTGLFGLGKVTGLGEGKF